MAVDCEVTTAGVGCTLGLGWVGGCGSASFRTGSLGFGISDVRTGGTVVTDGEICCAPVCCWVNERD